GAIAERYAYSAYGEPTILDPSGTVIASSSINNRYSYTGREWDATVGLYHFRARWMSPKSGRFLGRDPIEFEGSEWDLYEYCESNPMVWSDPNGTAVFVIPIVGAGSGAAAAAAAKAAAAFGAAGILACLQHPPCAAQIRVAVQQALANIDAATTASLIAACNIAYAGYKNLPSCDRCVRGYADNCLLSIWRCAHATKNFACHNTVAAARAAYLVSGCDVVLPPQKKDHWAAVEQALNGADRCRESMDNNCFGNGPLPELF
ncbi:MAG: RHS repeat domain-containing protein, partial [Pirellula sp.]